MPVKNRSRRFRYVANLDKRLAVQEHRAKIRENLRASFMLYMEELNSTHAGDDQGMDVRYEWAREAEETLEEDKEKEFLNEAPTAVCGSE